MTFAAPIKPGQRVNLPSQEEIDDAGEDDTGNVKTRAGGRFIKDGQLGSIGELSEVPLPSVEGKELATNPLGPAMPQYTVRENLEYQGHQEPLGEVENYELSRSDKDYEGEQMVGYDEEEKTLPRYVRELTPRKAGSEEDDKSSSDDD